MSYEYDPANLGNPLFWPTSQADQCTGVIQKPPQSKELPPSSGKSQLILPSSTLPQNQLPTSTISEGRPLPQDRIVGEEFELGGVLQSSSVSNLTSKFELGGAQPSSNGVVLSNSSSASSSMGVFCRSSSIMTPNVSENGSILQTSSDGGVLASRGISIATPNVASGDLLRQLVLDRPKLPLSRLMQVSSNSRRISYHAFFQINLTKLNTAG